MPPGAWWLGLVAGILELVLGFWASQRRLPAREALLLIGFFALFRGISEIVIAFELKSAQHRQGPGRRLRPAAPAICLRRWRYLAAGCGDGGECARGYKRRARSGQLGLGAVVDDGRWVVAPAPAAPMIPPQA